MRDLSQRGRRVSLFSGPQLDADTHIRSGGIIRKDFKVNRFEVIRMHSPPGVREFKGEDFVVDIVIEEHVSEIIRKSIEKIEREDEDLVDTEVIARPAGYFVSAPGDSGDPPVLYWIIT